jgi:TolA-binding protein
MKETMMRSGLRLLLGVGLAGAGTGAAQTRYRIEAGATAPGLEAQTRALAKLGTDLARLGTLGRNIGLSVAEAVTEEVRSWSDLAVTLPQAWNDQDPADSSYRAARSALNRSNYTQAAYLFRQVYERHPTSSYAADAYYYEAFALYRQGKTDGLRRALEVLDEQKRLHRRAGTRDDAIELATRIDAELASRGDESSSARVRRTAEAAAEVDEARADAARQAREARDAGRAGRAARRERCRDDDNDEKAAALDALISMDADRAIPLLKKVLARRDGGSVCLRRKAVFLISQHRGEESETLLLNAARNDPDQEVRENAIFWLGQSGGESAVAALDSILQSADDDAIREKAIFSLSQHSSSRANQALRDFALKSTAPVSLRENAIFWLGQSNRAENADFLRTIYKSTKERSLKDKIIFSLAQGGRGQSGRWLIEIVTDGTEEVETRKSALFWLGQSGSSISELFSLYGRLADRELREQMIFVYSQRRERAAVDKLIEIAKSDKERELRKKALFWLSQSKDPRVAELLEEILSKP